MTHGPILRERRPPMFVVTPGPTITAYVEGVEVARATITHSAALYLASQLLTAVSVRMPHETATPTENLPFCEHVARREMERNQC